MVTIGKDIKLLFRILCYGWILNYHLNKRKKVSRNHQTVLKYHLEMSEHFFYKIWGRYPD